MKRSTGSTPPGIPTFVGHIIHSLILRIFDHIGAYWLHNYLLVHRFVPVQPVGGAPVVRVLQAEVVGLQEVELLAHLLKEHFPACFRLKHQIFLPSVALTL